MKIFKIYITRVFCLVACFVIISCSSGEYDIEQYEINYFEKIITADTILNIVDGTDIKDEQLDQNQIKDEQSASYAYILQIGAFIVQANFENFYAAAREKIGPEVYYEMTYNLYKIRVGYYTNRAEAILFLSRLREMGYSDAFIISKKQ